MVKVTVKETVNRLGFVFRFEGWNKAEVQREFDAKQAECGERCAIIAAPMKWGEMTPYSASLYVAS